MGELWLTFFTPDSHAAKRRRRHLIDAAEKNRSARCRQAGQNYPERRRRKNNVGAGLYCRTIFRDQLYAYQHLTVGERALAGLTKAPPLDMGCWGGTTQHLERNVPELGAERPHLGRTWGGSTWGGSTEGRIDRYPKFHHEMARTCQKHR